MSYRDTLPPTSPLGAYQQSIKDHAEIVNRVAASFGDSLEIKPAPYGNVELHQGDESVRLNAKEIEWVADQFARLIGKVLADRGSK